MRRAVGLVLALAASAPAYAVDTYMWGVGPKIGTMVLPGQFPVFFPDEVEADGGLDKVGGDVITGANAYYYANANSRLGVTGGLNLGKGYFGAEALLGYDYVSSAQALDFILGGGIGAGTMTFRGDGSLTVPYYPVRANAGALIRDGMRGYEAKIFGQFDIPARHIFENAAGAEAEASGGLYATLGLEVSVLFGDFEPPRKSKKK
jgi:hypothetical protein